MNDTAEHTREPLTPAQAVKHLRSVLAVTQEELATALGLSSKAIQSYEQGWRKAPPRVIKQLLTLVAINREDYTQSKKCWDVRACPPEISEPCLASKLTHGHYCWAVASNICTAAGSDDPTIFGCLRCDVVQQFLETA